MENLVDSDRQAAVHKLRVSEPLTKTSHDDTVMLRYRCTNLHTARLSAVWNSDSGRRENYRFRI
jgi:hypothetical protein